MRSKVLLVDDELNLLHSLRRSFRNKYELILAEGGEAGIGAIKADNSIAVVVSDMQMPNINGITVLQESRKLSPNTVRIMLTGNIDQQTAVNAVNLGGVFRFVNKPCEPEELSKIIDEAIQLHDQLTAEKILLSRTLIATVGLSTELLAMANPQAHGRASRLKLLAKKVGQRMGTPDVWQLEIASMLSQIGCVAVATQIDKAPEPFSPGWDSMLQSQADASSQMIEKIPRLERAAAIIRFQCSDSVPADMTPSDRQYSKVLRMLIAFDLLSQSNTTVQALKLMEKHPARFEAELLMLLTQAVLGDAVVLQVSVKELMVGMVLEDHVLNAAGDILISKGHELTETIIQRLRNFERSGVGVQEPITVRTTQHAAAA